MMAISKLLLFQMNITSAFAFVVNTYGWCSPAARYPNYHCFYNTITINLLSTYSSGLGFYCPLHVPLSLESQGYFQKGCLVTNVSCICLCLLLPLHSNADGYKETQSFNSLCCCGVCEISLHSILQNS